jgi:tetratricopeptide (TPR) repeat protein
MGCSSKFIFGHVLDTCISTLDNAAIDEYCIQLGRPQQALEKLRLAHKLDVDKELPQLPYNLGIACIQNRLIDEAIVHVKSSLKNFPKYNVRIIST